MSRLPLEITYLILSEIDRRRNSVPDLKSASLACRAWRMYCQACIFREVTVDAGDGPLETELACLAFLALHAHLVEHVQSLSVLQNPTLADEFLGWLPVVLTNVTRIVIFAVYNEELDHAAAVARFVLQCPSLQELIVTFHSIDSNHVIMAIDSAG